MASNKKLVTLKGVTVTQGYVDGTMSLWDTVDYLSRLGIHGLFEDVVTKAVFVPPGAQAQNTQSNRTYAEGDFIPVPEHSWEEFVQSVQSDESRNQHWVITDAPVASPEPIQETPVSREDYDKAMGKLVEKYDERELGRIFSYLKQQAESIPDQQQKEAQLNAVHEFISDASAKMQEYEAVAKQGALKLSDVVDAKELIRNFEIASELRYNKASNNFNIKIGKGQVHFGALVATLELAGNRVALNQLESIIQTGGYANNGIELPMDSLFGVSMVDENGKVDPEAVELYKDVLTKLDSTLPEDKLIMGVSQVADKMRNIRADKVTVNVEVPQDILDAAEKLRQSVSKVVDVLNDIKDADGPIQELREAFKNLEFMKEARATYASLTSGNLMVQSVLDFSHMVNGKLTSDILGFLDKYFVFPAGKTITDRLGKYVGGKIPPEELAALKTELYTTPVQPKNLKISVADRKLVTTALRRAMGKTLSTGGTVVEVSSGELPKEVIEGVLTYGSGNLIQYFKDNNHHYKIQDLDLFFSKLVANFLAKSSTVTKETQYDANGKEIPQWANQGRMTGAAARDLLIESLKDYETAYYASQGIDISTISTWNRIADSVERTASLQKTFFAETKKVFAPLTLNRLRGNVPPFLNSDGSPKLGKSAETSSREAVTPKALEGILALVNHQLMKHQNVVREENIDHDADRRAAIAITYFCGEGVKVDPATGSFTHIDGSGRKYMSMRVLGLARFLPPLGKEGYEWAPEYKERIDQAILENRVKDKNPSLEISDRDRMAYVMEGETEFAPIHLLGENIRAGLRNVTKGNRNGTTPNSGPLLTREESQHLGSLIDYDTHPGTNGQRINKLNTSLRSYVGTKPLTDNLLTSLISEDVSPDAFSGVSIAAMLGAYHYDEAVPDEADDRFFANVGAIIDHRVRAELRNASKGVADVVADYAKELLEQAKTDLRSNKTAGNRHVKPTNRRRKNFEPEAKAGSTQLGTVAESLINVGSVMGMLGSSKIKKAEVVRPKMVRSGTGSLVEGKHSWDAFRGLRWETADGSVNYFGKINGVNNGAVDEFLLSEKDGITTISGFETKIEKAEPTLPHLGNATDVTRMLGSYYKKKIEAGNPPKKVIITDNTLVSAGWNSPANNTYATGYTYDGTDASNHVDSGFSYHVGLTGADRDRQQREKEQLVENERRNKELEGAV